MVFSASPKYPSIAGRLASKFGVNLVMHSTTVFLANHTVEQTYTKAICWVMSTCFSFFETFVTIIVICMFKHIVPHVTTR